MENTPNTVLYSSKQEAASSRFMLSLLCGMCPAMVYVLHPVISFYLSNEGEFWFSLGSVIGCVSLVFGGVAILLALLHFFLTERGRVSPRLLFAALVAALSLCAFVQSGFLSSYLPVLTGDPIDWSLYPGWNMVSIVLWVTVPIVFIVLATIRPRLARTVVYVFLAMLLCMELITCGLELVTAKHEGKKEDAYFSDEGLYETAEAGNVVVLISDTFQGTYMNEILERYPEYKKTLKDCTYYDNVTGTSCFTYFSYANIMTGVDFPIGANMQSGVSYCFNHQTTVDKIVNKGWDVEYYTIFSPTENLSESILNYCDENLEPDQQAAWTLTGMLLKSTLFQSMPQPLKKHFLVYTEDYESVKTTLDTTGIPKPFVQSDRRMFNKLKKKASCLTAVSGKPRYMILEMKGVHEPCNVDADFKKVEYDDTVSIKERKIQGARAQLKFLRRYLDQLKKAGTYDQTTVIMTADHGYDMRFYPVFLVKEANRKKKKFSIDHSPISMREDYQGLLERMTSGQRFSEAVSDLNLPSDRIRYAVDYSSAEGYMLATDRKTIVTIKGDASQESSYFIEKDEYWVNDAFAGRCKIGTPFFSSNGNSGDAAVYGLQDISSTGHTVIFDMFLDEEIAEPLEFRVKLQNVTNADQRLLFTIGDMTIGETTLAVKETGELSLNVPPQAGKRLTVEVSMPDAVKEIMPTEVLGWNWYRSFAVLEAGLYRQDS